MGKKNILTIFGGQGMEYYAGCKAFGDAIGKIDREKFNVIELGITPEGKWLLTNASSDEIKDGKSWIKREDNKEAFITPVYGDHNLTYIDNGEYKKIHIDAVFPLIAGYGGEDGRIQGMLEISGIPYVGSGMMASACSLDKEMTRIFAEFCELKQPECVILKKEDFENNVDVDKLISFGYPVFVKPANGGTSVGITRVDNKKDLSDAIATAFKYDNKILIEQQIVGTEIKVSILGNKNLTFGALCELELPKGEINDYETKQNSISKKTIPAEIEESLANEFMRQAGAIYHRLGCRGFARVDFFLTADKQIYFNEINTVPGLGENSIYSIMFNKAGVSFKDLLTKLIYTAFE